MLLNNRQGYGSVAIILHWLMAVLIIGLFAMGLWMVELGYYDSWYNRAPELHKSLGILTLFIFLFRVAWRFANPLPDPEPSLKVWERKASRFVHISFYLLIFIVILSGYLISTAGKNPVPFFGWFELPGLFTPFEHQEDIAGEVHLAASWLMMALVALHTLASLKHHFFDRDKTLLKMLGRNR